MEIKDGYYEAVPVDYEFAEIGKNALPAIKVYFDLNGKIINWTGFLTDKSKKTTLQSLITMGFRGSDLSPLAYGKASNALDMTKAVSITVENEEYNGKQYARVKWVNPVKAVKTLDPNVIDKIKGLKLDVDLLEIQQALGIAPKKQDDLPF